MFYRGPLDSLLHLLLPSLSLCLWTTRLWSSYSQREENNEDWVGGGIFVLLSQESKHVLNIHKVQQRWLLWLLSCCGWQGMITQTTDPSIFLHHVKAELWSFGSRNILGKRFLPLTNWFFLRQSSPKVWYTDRDWMKSASLKWLWTTQCWQKKTNPKEPPFKPQGLILSICIQRTTGGLILLSFKLKLYSYGGQRGSKNKYISHSMHEKSAAQIHKSNAKAKTQTRVCFFFILLNAI